MTPDRELLRQYAETGDEAAFAEVVERGLPLVYHAALRLMGGDSHLAEDVAQGVFTDLACKARALAQHDTLAGWLHTTTRYRCAKLRRAEIRRQRREEEAALMHELHSAPDRNFAQLRPELDDAIGRLPSADREALLLRFFQGKSYAEAAAVLGQSENTLNKRVERALEKLRVHFARRGVTTTAALLASSLAAHAAIPPPAGLAAKITGASLAGAANTGSGYLLTHILLMSTKTKIALAAVVIILLALLPVAWPLFKSPAENAASAPLPVKKADTSSPAAFSRVATPVVAAPATPARAPLNADGNTTVAQGHGGEPKEYTAWTMGAFLPSSDWKNAGANTPENALQTIYWARKNGETEREQQLLMEPPVVSTNQLKRAGTTLVAAQVSSGRPDYGKLLGGTIVRRKVVSPTIVQMNVNEDWEGAADTIQEFFEFHFIDGKWKYTQSYQLAD